jgi:capsular polysaccharide biosynthesis protein
MSEPSELRFSAVRDKRARQCSPLPLERTTVNMRPVSPPATPPAEPACATPIANTAPRSRRRIDLARLAVALKDRSQQIFISAGALAAVAFLAGYFLSNHHARVTLVARDASTAFVAGLEGEPYRPQQLTAATLVSLMESPELARRVAAKTKPPMQPDALAGKVQAEAVRNTDLVALTVAGKDRQSLVDLANLCANEAVDLTKELQLSEAARMDRFCREKLAGMDKELQQANAALVKFQSETKLVDPDAEKQSHIKSLGDVMSRADNLRIEAELLEVQVAALQGELAQQNPTAQKLAAARSKLGDMLTRLTEEHPSVRGQRQEIAQLEKQLANTGKASPLPADLGDNSLANAIYLRLVEFQTRKATAQKELQGLDRLKQSLQEKVTGISEKATQYALLKARLEGLQKSRSLLASRQREAQLYQDHAQGYYRVFTPATLKDIDTTSRWLSGIWAALASGFIGLLGAGLVVAGAEVTDSRLKSVADVEQVTGLPVLATLGDLNSMSAADREAWAFRTWTALAGQLSASANHGMICGFVSSTTGEGRSTWIDLLARAARRRGLQAVTVGTRQEKNKTGNGSHPEAAGAQAELFTATATSQALAIQMDSPNELAVQIPLPGSVWSLEHRKLWQDALARCQAMDNLVMLIELPPASVPESVLLAESLPQLIWLADSRKARARATREQLATMRHARCRLVGAVLNHEPKPVFNL